MSFKAHFQRAFAARPARVHLAAHSHHLWPDASFAAHAQAWLDAAEHADGKWEKIFSDQLPRAREHVARVLHLSDPSTLAFAPNTHELVKRVFSSLPAATRRRRVRVLTTDGEFHSFARQLSRWEEDDSVEVCRTATEPFATLATRLAEAAARESFDVVLFSQVLYGSGFNLRDLSSIVRAVRDEGTFVVVDGYHGFMAVPTDLSAIEKRAFYVAGGYKYAMSGEGCCFLHAPPGYGPRPVDTGWFAAFDALEGERSDHVQYAPTGSRFLGATFDPTAIYRLVGVMDWMRATGLTVDTSLAHVRRLERILLSAITSNGGPLSEERLVLSVDSDHRGRFLAFSHPDAHAISRALAKHDVVTDVRGDRIRFGLGVYLDDADVQRAANVLGTL